MKKVILSVLVLLAISVSSCKNQAKKEVALTEKSFGVRGNCGMCKHTIEKAASSVEGVSIANWDKEKKKIEVSFDSLKTTETAIQNAIAASGYDTESISADKTAYKGLPGCCQYDHTMKMNK